MQLTPFGLMFKHRILLKLMGKENFGNYLKLLELHFDEWRAREFSYLAFPLAKINQLLEKAGVEKIDPANIHFERFRLRRRSSELRVQIAASKCVVRALESSSAWKKQQKEKAFGKIEQVLAEVEKAVQ